MFFSILFGSVVLYSTQLCKVGSECSDEVCAMHLPTECRVQHAECSAVVEGRMGVSYSIQLLPYPGLP